MGEVISRLPTQAAEAREAAGQSGASRVVLGPASVPAPPPLAAMAETNEPRAVVSWNGPGQPVVLALYGPDGEELALPLEPKRALTLAKELIEPAVQAISADPTAPWAAE